MKFIEWSIMHFQILYYASKNVLWQENEKIVEWGFAY